MAKTIKSRLLCLFLALLLACSCLFVFAGCVEYPDKYTLEQHTERISKRVDERYFSDSSAFTDYTLYPLYNDKDELRYFLVEFEPQGFVFVAISSVNTFIKSFFAVTGMYVRDDTYIEDYWQRYRLSVDGREPLPYNGKEWQNYDVEPYRGNKRFEVDDNGEYVKYFHSPYAVANVLGQKLYFLDVYLGYVPAIKQNGKYVNLISMEEFDYQGRDYYYRDYSKVPCIAVYFIADSDFDL